MVDTCWYVPHCMRVSPPCAVTAVPLPSETVMMQPSLALSSAFALAPDSRVEPGMVFDEQPMRLQSGAAAARPINAEGQGQADARAAGET